MRWSVRFAIVLSGLALLPASSSAQADWVKLEAADAGFSVSFPGTPTLQTTEKPASVTRLWSARVGKILCLIAVTDYNAHIDAEKELTLDMANLLKEIKGTATSQQKSNFRDAPDGPLPALQFSFTMAGWTGQSLVVVAGDRAYQATAVAAVGSDTKDLPRCLALKVTAKSRHWQAP